MYIFMFLPFIYIQRKIDVLAKTTIIASTHVNILWTRRSLFISLNGSSFFMFFIDLIVEILHTIQIPAATNLVILIYFIFLTFLLSVPDADRLILRPIVMVHFFYQIKGRIRCLNVFEDFSLYCMGFIQFRTEYQSICCLFTCFCISFS